MALCVSLLSRKIDSWLGEVGSLVKKAAVKDENESDYNLRARQHRECHGRLMSSSAGYEVIRYAPGNSTGDWEASFLGHERESRGCRRRGVTQSSESKPSLSLDRGDLLLLSLQPP